MDATKCTYLAGTDAGWAHDGSVPLAASSSSYWPAAERPHGSNRCPQHEGMQWPARRDWGGR